jgi:hypothetical protein
MSTTAQQHARIYRKIINLNNGGGHLDCMLLDCERQAYSNFVVLEHRHPGHWNCDYANFIDPATHIRLGFCSERHKTMYVEGSGWRALRLAEERGGGVFGYLPTGSRGMMS